MNSVRQSLRIALSRFPLAGCAGLPPQAGAEQPVLSVEQLTKEMPCEALLCPRLRGGKRTRFVGERQRPENRVRRFPVEGGGADRHQRGAPQDGIYTGAEAPTKTLGPERPVKLKKLKPLHPRSGCQTSGLQACPPLLLSRYLLRHAFHGQGEWVIGVLVYKQSAVIGGGRYGQVFVGEDMGHREAQGFREDCFFFLRTG